MIPDWSMCANSSRATLSCSGARRRGRAETGGPVVCMWCVTVCFTGSSKRCGRVRDGKSARMAAYSFSGVRGTKVGLIDESEEEIP